MADIQDVMQALRDRAAAALYPNGVPAGTMPASVAGVPVRVYVGWPNAALDTDLGRGIAQVTVYPRGTARNLGPYIGGWQDDEQPEPSMGALVEDDRVSFYGSGTAPGMIAAVLPDASHAYTYQLQPGDTPSAVAAALASLMAMDWPDVAAAGAILTVPGAIRLRARVVIGGTESMELRRVAQGVVVAVWAPSPESRNAITQAVDVAIERNRRMRLPDGTGAFVTYESTAYDEAARQQPLYRRDLMLSVEFSMADKRGVPPVAVPDVSAEPEDAPITRVIT
jgi:hypothetical protein